LHAEPFLFLAVSLCLTIISDQLSSYLDTPGRSWRVPRAGPQPETTNKQEFIIIIIIITRLFSPNLLSVKDYT
jgi:hypothetical protein